MVEIQPALLQTTYAQLNDLLGPELTYQVYELYRGRQVSFPMRLYDSQKVSQQIVQEYDGHNIAALTRKYRYSQRWVRQILQNNRQA
ncbi:hypothetical protein LFAB_06330 [Lactiplantibacillus fabifermentans T30PCM01]|uniref:Mor transcription activator domain-containing protein n=1 Tax=Lactiplantibacillus fabifermentans T30PCM01 TaxID=1400520 RepID=W6T9N8_9LACO|nr:Mor transcription activator family protein [Lactiplantibacillus fabifermentans]ETY74598.1 hypothetical protein LFAB_06330 [Lactiplantibacillus fabifermentans T30PCM01]